MTRPIETSIEPITAWRFWSLTRDPSDGLRLGPAGYGLGDWTPREAFRARCKASAGYPSHPPKSNRHRSPTLSCTCGIYAMGSLPELVKPGRTPLVGVVGSVSLWGRVIEHELGWRAQFAYPQRLRIACVACLHQAGGPVAAVTVVRGVALDDGLVGLCGFHRLVLEGVDLEEEDGAEVQAELLDTYAVDLLPLEALAFVGTRPRLMDGTQWHMRVGQLLPPPPVVPPVRHDPPAPVPVVTHRPPTVVVPPRPPLVRRIGRGIGIGLFWSLAVFCYFQSSIVTVLGPAPTSSSAPMMEPARVLHPSGFEGHRVLPPEPEVQQVEIMCGRLADSGERIEIVPCTSKLSLLLGAAWKPPNRCTSLDVAVSRGDGYSICWFSVDPKFQVPHRLMPAPNPFKHEEADDRVG